MNRYINKKGLVVPPTPAVQRALEAIASKDLRVFICEHESIFWRIRPAGRVVTCGFGGGRLIKVGRVALLETETAIDGRRYPVYRRV